MNITHRLLRRVPPQFRTLIQRIGYFIFGTGLTVFYAQIVHAQSSASSAPVRTPYTATTIIAAIIAAVITVFFLRGMYLVLTYASQTYGLENEDEHRSTAEENNSLLLGAAFWVVGSAIIIASYGLGWQFLFLGPIICLLGPLVPIFAMRLDIKNYREILRRRTIERSISDPDSEFVHRS